MQIRIGLANNDLASFTHSSASFTSKGILKVAALDAGRQQSATVAGKTLVVEASEAGLCLSGLSSPLAGHLVRISPVDPACAISVTSLVRTGCHGKINPCYKGTIEVKAVGGKLQIVLVCSLDAYLQGVLSSEMPSSYHQEALKAQAVTARTYALHPRIDHCPSGFNVCDSYLCCQNFIGNAHQINPFYDLAINATHNQILTYQGKPLLALFSSCAGGHTESYENCFSDPITQAFPPPPLAYLKGVPEGRLLLNLNREADLRKLWNMPRPGTYDSWSPHFRWKVILSANDLEAHMHHIIDTMRSNREFSPFIKAPASGQFGHIDSFEISRRGISGTAISMLIHTSTGSWTAMKEIVIRNLFKNPDIKLERLKSARIFINHYKDRLGLLSRLEVYGLGWGHGVGLQQTGAQGLALAGKNYRQILSHYFAGSAIQVVD